MAPATRKKRAHHFVKVAGAGSTDGDEMSQNCADGTSSEAEQPIGDKSCDMKLADSSDDGSSTCVPNSSDYASSSQGTPITGPLKFPDGIGALPELLQDHRFCDSTDQADTGKKRFEVCIIHHDEMQLHVPPKTENVFELPRRVIAIENRLKGLDTHKGFPRRQIFGEAMQFLPASPGKGSKTASPGKGTKIRTLVSAFGSSAKKKRRASYSTGPSSEGSVWDACRIVEAPLVKESDLLLAHSELHIAKVKEACALAASENAAFHPLLLGPQQKPRRLDYDDMNGDLYYSPNTLTSLRRAVGGAVEAVRQLFWIDPWNGRAVGRSDVGASFAIVRPPGHHCCDEPSGFCFFNNTAVAASHARTVLGLSRVAIVDWDYHHGDGTQTAFYRDPTVLTISLHVAMLDGLLAFPATGDQDLACNGLGLGRGYNINIPWPHNRAGAEEYDEAFRTIVIPALQGFDPELILVASGFDATEGDILAGTRLPSRSFYDMTNQLVALGKPMAVILEGGYSPDLLAQSSLNVVHALLGMEAPSLQSRPSADEDSAPGRRLFHKQPCPARPVDISSAGVLDATRRRLNTLRPWSSMGGPGGAQYFHEDPSPQLKEASESAAAEFRDLLMLQLAA